MPFFSIIIPTYNRADRIGQTIQSVLKQEFGDWELIIIDDGSQDDTKSVISTFIDSRIKYIYQENAERGAARNNGVRKAEGNYVFFLDSDDLIYPDHLQYAYDEINKIGQPEFFHIRYEEVFEDKKREVPVLYESTLLKQVYRRNQFACQFFLRKDIAENFPFSENRDLKIGEDWEVVLKIAVRYPLHFSNLVLSAIVQHGNRTMEIANAEIILRSRDILLENLSKDEKITERVKINVFAELTSLAALAYAIEGRKAESFKFWWNSTKKNSYLFFSRRTLAIFKKILLGGKA